MDKFNIYIKGELYAEDYEELQAMNVSFVLREIYGEDNIEIKNISTDIRERM